MSICAFFVGITQFVFWQTLTTQESDWSFSFGVWERHHCQEFSPHRPQNKVIMQTHTRLKKKIHPNHQNYGVVTSMPGSAIDNVENFTTQTSKKEGGSELSNIIEAFISMFGSVPHSIECFRYIRVYRFVVLRVFRALLGYVQGWLVDPRRTKIRE